MEEHSVVVVGIEHWIDYFMAYYINTKHYYIFYSKGIIRINSSYLSIEEIGDYWSSYFNDD